jgi:ribosomal protein L29
MRDPVFREYHLESLNMLRGQVAPDQVSRGVIAQVRRTIARLRAPAQPDAPV